MKAVENKSSCPLGEMIKPNYQPPPDKIRRCQIARVIGYQLLVAIADLHRFFSVGSGFLFPLLTKIFLTAINKTNNIQ